MSEVDDGHETVPSSRSGKHKKSRSLQSETKVPKKRKRAIRKHNPVGLEKQATAREMQEAVEVRREKTGDDKRMIVSALQRFFIFSSLMEEQIDVLTESMRLFSLKAQQVVYEEDKPAMRFFILAAGKLDKQLNGRTLGTINPGSGFGELALLHDTVRTETVRCKFDSMVWALDRKTFKNFVESINAQQYEENKAFLSTVHLFEVLTESQKEKLLSVLTTSKFANGAKIVTEGEKGEVFFIIKEGNVSCQKGGKEIRRMTKGEYFGEQALLYGGVRTATVVAVSAVKVLSIGANDLLSCFDTTLQQVIYRNSLRIAFDRYPPLKRLDKDQMDQLISCVNVRNYSTHEVVVKEGTVRGSGVWVVLRGELGSGRGQEIKVRTFELLGDFDFRNKELYEFPVVVTSDMADVGLITKEELEGCIGGPLASATVNNKAKQILSSMYLFRTLSKDHLSRLSKALTLRSFENGEVIVRQHDRGDSFYIIESGAVQVLKDGVPIRTISKEDYFGERSILFNDARSATIVASGAVTCWMLHQQEFNQLIDEHIRNHLVKRIKMQDDSITLKDLVAVKPLGKGMYGVVLLAVHPQTRQLYAIKSIKKTKVQQFHLKESLLAERDLLRQLDHTFVMKLIKTTKDDTHLHFITEYVRGRDFFDILRDIDGYLQPNDARFYLAVLILIVESLHERNIIHRDIKPENIMVDEEGYPKLIDFGTAKVVSGRTYTIIGTPHYMAPEVVSGKGYNLSADYWSLGVILYESVFGRVPFGEDEENTYKIYERVMKEQLVFPPWSKKVAFNTTKTAIEALLNRNPAMRLGGTIDHFKTQSLFHGLDWVLDRQGAMLDRKTQPPFTPQLESIQNQVEEAIRNQLPVKAALLVSYM